MDKQAIARELVAVARELTGADRIAATKDVAEILEAMPDERAKQELRERKEKELRDELQALYGEAEKEVEKKTKELLTAIQKTLEAFFKKTGMGVRKSQNYGTMIEVFIGSNDGVDRGDSKVSVSIHPYGNPSYTYMLRNENISKDVKRQLAERGTITKLMAAVKKAYENGYWDDAWR